MKTLKRFLFMLILGSLSGCILTEDAPNDRIISASADAIGADIADIHSPDEERSCTELRDCDDLPVEQNQRAFCFRPNPNSEGSCIIQCKEGFRSCDDDILGCEADLKTIETCNSCSNPCETNSTNFAPICRPTTEADSSENAYICDFDTTQCVAGFEHDGSSCIEK